MRFAACLAVLVLAGCDQPQVQPAGGTAAADPVLQTEAEKACAQMTNNIPEKLQGMSAETQALVQREFRLCVDEVTKGDQADEAPGLRGRTEAPPT
jgi:hypothetical protein